MRINKFNRHFAAAISAMAIIFFAELPGTIAAPAEVIIYGTPGCPYCIEMNKWLDQNKIPYVFKDVTFPEGSNVSAENDEMSDVVVKANYKTSYYFPVMVIKGQVVMRPSTGDVKKALAGEKISGMEERDYKDPTWRPGYPKSMLYSYEDIRSRVRDGDVTIYDNNSADGKKMELELKKEKVPYKYVVVQLSGPLFSSLRKKLDNAGFGTKTILPVADVRGQMIMNAGANDIQLMLIQSLGD